MSRLVAAVQPSQLWEHDERLLGALLPGLSHAHSKIRLAVLAAVSAIAEQVSARAALRPLSCSVQGTLTCTLHTACWRCRAPNTPSEQPYMCQGMDSQRVRAAASRLARRAQMLPMPSSAST